MSANDPGRGPNLEVDPSERSGQQPSQKPEKEKEKDGDDSATDSPKTASKGINPVQHSE